MQLLVVLTKPFSLSLQVEKLSQLKPKQVDQLSQLTEEQIDTLLKVPPGFDFTKIPSDVNNIDFDEAVTILDNVDPNDLPILPEEDYDYYDDEDEPKILRRHSIPFEPSPEFFAASSKLDNNQALAIKRDELNASSVMPTTLRYLKFRVSLTLNSVTAVLKKWHDCAGNCL